MLAALPTATTTTTHAGAVFRYDHWPPPQLVLFMEERILLHPHCRSLLLLLVMIFRCARCHHCHYSCTSGIPLCSQPTLPLIE